MSPAISQMAVGIRSRRHINTWLWPPRSYSAQASLCTLAYTRAYDVRFSRDSWRATAIGRQMCPINREAYGVTSIGNFYTKTERLGRFVSLRDSGQSL